MTERHPDPSAVPGPLTVRAGDMPADDGRAGQNFHWGRARWLVEPDSLGTERVSVGLITIAPRSDDREHSHYGEEQVIYVISGQGRHTVNGQTSTFGPGDTLYIPPYSRHLMANDGDDDLRVLTVYIPSRVQPILSESEAQFCDLNHKFDLLSSIDAEVVKRLLSELAQSLHQSLRLIGPDGTCLMASDNQPAVCRLLGQAGAHCQRHIEESLSEINSFNKSHLLHCCGQITSIIVPIISNNIVSGYIKCGEFFLGSEDRAATADYLLQKGMIGPAPGRDSAEELLSDITVDKKNKIYTLAESTVAVARYIAEMSVAVARRKEQENQQLSIMRGQMNEAQLKQALQEAELKLLQAQLNPHFLFNTLNTIGHLAYLEGAEKAADLVHSLSNILRTALGKVKTMIPLREELELLRAYLNIQSSRFGRRLQASIKVDRGLEEYLLPGLTLQPIVENSIMHGVESNLGRVKIKIRISRQNERIQLTVEDNGPGLPDGAQARPGVGLGSVTARLQHHFKEFGFELKNRPEGGVRTRITLPLEAPESRE